MQRDFYKEGCATSRHFSSQPKSVLLVFELRDHNRHLGLWQLLRLTPQCAHLLCRWRSGPVADKPCRFSGPIRFGKGPKIVLE